MPQYVMVPMGETIRFGPQDEIHQRELCEHFETLIKTTLDNLKEIHVSHLEADFWLKRNTNVRSF